MKPLDAIKEQVDLKVTSCFASDIAKFLKSKPVANTKLVVGEDFSPYKIPYHTDAFFCFIFVSDRSYSFTAKHRQETKAIVEAAEFCISLKQPVAHMGIRKRLDIVSGAIGIEVFTQKWMPEEDLTPKLMKSPVLEKLKHLDYDGVEMLFVSQMQMSAKAVLKSSEHCAKQVRLMREIFTIVFQDAWDKRHTT